MGALGRDAFFEFLVAQDIRYVFGNPGTTELPLIDGFGDYPSVRYVLSLHEDVAVAQAMGYARASGKVGVVNLHVTPGVAHGLGNLYNAYRARIPLLVVAGQHATGLQVQEPILTSDLAGLVRPFTKWAYDVTRLDELPVVLQRAFKELSTPPYGPVFLSFPMDLMLQKCDGFPPARVSSVGPVVADPEAVAGAAGTLRSATRPLILAGDGVGHARAWDELAALAEAVGAPVFTEGYATLWNFPADHPLSMGPMPNVASGMRDQFADVDVALLCGVTCQAPISRYDDGGPLVPWHVRTVALDDSPWEVGKNQPVEAGLVGDVKRNLVALLDAVRAAPAPDDVAARRDGIRAVTTARVEHWAEQVRAARASDSLSATLVAAELRDLLPPDAVFVDEAISNRPSFVNVLRFGDPLSYFAVNGLSLGYSTGAAVGIQMALPERRVVNVVGDGSLLYYPQALWNAASAGTPVLFVVLNNSSYRVLKVIFDRMEGTWTSHRDALPGIDISAPGIDFVALGRSLGLEAQRVTDPAELRPALERGLDAASPAVVEVVLQQP